MAPVGDWVTLLHVYHSGMVSFCLIDQSQMKLLLAEKGKMMVEKATNLRRQKRHASVRSRKYAFDTHFGTRWWGLAGKA